MVWCTVIVAALLASRLSMSKLSSIHPDDYEGNFKALYGIPGEPGIDYPILDKTPHTNFHCSLVQPGFYADIETGCQVWHYCDMDGRHDSFLCPNGTLFNQIVLICDWWYNVDCASSLNAYLINSGLYRPSPKLHYILPQTI